MFKIIVISCRNKINKIYKLMLYFLLKKEKFKISLFLKIFRRYSQIFLPKIYNKNN